MNIHIEKLDQATTTVIAIDGQLNSTTTAQIQDQVLMSAHEGRRVLLDMSGVNYLSSAGLRMLLLLYRRVRENHGIMALAGLSEEVSDVMSITGFLDLFTVYEDRNDGLTAFRKAG
jgi:anti-sigma B factor antagonist